MRFTDRYTAFSSALAFPTAKEYTFLQNTNRRRMLNMQKIIRNAIRCNICNDVIESKRVHEYKVCSCGACGVDGGHEYLRRTFREKGCFTELSVTEVPEENVEQH